MTAWQEEEPGSAGAGQAPEGAGRERGRDIFIPRDCQSREQVPSLQGQMAQKGGLEKLISGTTESSKLREGWEGLPKRRPGQPRGAGAVGRGRGPVLHGERGLGAQHGALSMGKFLLKSFPQATNRDN